MDYRISGIYNRCVTIELNNEDSFHTKAPVSVSINGEKIYDTDRNVIYLDGLTPDTTYEVEINGKKQTFKTKSETVLLDVCDFGAAGDGVHDDTAAVQAAISACPAGGTVYIPAGKYRCTPIFLKSRITVYIDTGAEILGETDREKYPKIPGMVTCQDEVHEISFASWEGNPLTSYASLFTAIDAKEIDIIGRGTINGNANNGDWWKYPKVKRGAWRPNTFFAVRCSHIRMAGVTVMNSPAWTIHPYYSDRLEFCCISIKNPADSPNTDGIDPESCSNVLISGTVIDVGDDCIAIKSGKYYMAKYHHKPSSEIVVRNCLFKNGHGAVTIGSEIAGGVNHLKVTQCVFEGTDRGVRIKTRRGRGKESVLDDLKFDHIVMNDIPMPVTVNMFYFCDPDGHSKYVQDKKSHEVDDMTPSIGKISISDTVCHGVDASLLCVEGLPEMPVEAIELKGISADFIHCGKRVDMTPVMMDQFEPISGIPIFAENVKQLTVDDVSVTGEDLNEDVLAGIADSSFKDYTVRNRRKNGTKNSSISQGCKEL